MNRRIPRAITAMNAISAKLTIRRESLRKLSDTTLSVIRGGSDDHTEPSSEGVPNGGGACTFTTR